jgi:hypothetical protein
MNKFNYKLASLIFCTIALSILSSCSKEKETIKPINQAPQSEQLFSTTLDEIINVVSAVQTSGSSFKDLAENELLSCGVTNIDTSTLPYVYTIDFGTGCTSSNGKTRSGKIVVTFDNKKMMTIGAAANINFQNYKVDNFEIVGDFFIQNKAYNDNNNLVFGLQFDIEGRLESSLSNVLTMKSVSTIEYEWVEGIGTPTIEDDKFAANGHFIGKDENGVNYAAHINKPIVKSRSTTCSPFFISGKIEYTQNNQPDVFIDYGGLTCDDIATVTINGQTQTIVLK